jgi:hypothetical protein
MKKDKPDDKPIDLDKFINAPNPKYLKGRMLPRGIKTYIKIRSFFIKTFSEGPRICIGISWPDASQLQLNGLPALRTDIHVPNKTNLKLVREKSGKDPKRIIGYYIPIQREEGDDEYPDSIKFSRPISPSQYREVLEEDENELINYDNDGNEEE